MVQLTIIDANKKMLPGTDIPAALVTLDPIDEIDVLGMNCGVGPDLMNDDIRHLSRHSRKLLSVLPNAGLPETRGDETYFPLDPAGLAYLARPLRYRVRGEYRRRMLRHARTSHLESGHATAFSGKSPRETRRRCTCLL